MGGYPPHGTGTGDFPRPGGTAPDKAADTAEVGRKVVLQLGGVDERAFRV